MKKNCKILSEFGRKEFKKEEIEFMEKEYDDISTIVEEQNKEIDSMYWKDKADTLLEQLKNYKDYFLLYIHDIIDPYDNHFIECSPRMIKGKKSIWWFQK